MYTERNDESLLEASSITSDFILFSELDKTFAEIL